MATTKRTWLWVILGIAGALVLLVIVFIGGAIYTFRTHVKNEYVENTVAEREFTQARARFAGQQPLIEFTGDSDRSDDTKVHRPAADAPRVEITPVGTVATSGQQSVQPTQNTTYNLTATGPGGTVTSTASVNVNNAVQANLAAKAQVKADEAVIETARLNLSWTRVTSPVDGLAGIALAQIGEFSFILATIGRDLGLLTTVATNALVASSIVSIVLNPLIYRAIDPIERWVSARPALARLLSRQSDASAHIAHSTAHPDEPHRAIVIGYGPTAPGEMEGLLPAGFERSLRQRLPGVVLEEGRVADQEGRHLPVLRSQNLVINRPLRKWAGPRTAL